MITALRGRTRFRVIVVSLDYPRSGSQRTLQLNITRPSGLLGFRRNGRNRAVAQIDYASIAVRCISLSIFK